MKIINILKNLFKDKTKLYFLGSTDKLLPPLSKEEEEKLVLLSNQGNIDARNKLIEHNLRLVVFLSKKYDNTSYDLEDLVSIGTIGLIKGVDTYNPDKPVKLITYAAKCIENEILMYIRQNKKNLNNVSLNDSIGYDKEGNEITLMEVIKDDYIDSSEVINLKDNILLLKKYFNVLNKREKDIIIRRYGLLNNKEETQREIAKDLKISRSYVSRIEKRALVKLYREFIKNNNI